MQISPFVPGFGLLLILVNLGIAAVRPYFPPTAMGIQLFIGGMTTLIIAVLDLISPVGAVVGNERILLFVAGVINCSAGYYMVLLEIRKRGG